MEPAPSILVVEDERTIRRFVREALAAEGYRVHEAGTLAQGLADAGTRAPDLVVLDLGLPDGDGLRMLRDLRAWSSVPVIVLTARGGEPDKVEALDAGADDYVTKPFGIPELLARVRAALRRSQGTVRDEDGVVRFGDVTLDLAARTCRKGEQGVHLTPTEFRLLAALVRRPGVVQTQRHLLASVWGPSALEQTHYLRLFMGQLRHKLEDVPGRPRHLLTQAGVGYRFEP